MGQRDLGRGQGKRVLPKDYSFECPQKGSSNLVILMYIFSIPHLNPESSTEFAIKFSSLTFKQGKSQIYYCRKGLSVVTNHRMKQ